MPHILVVEDEPLSRRSVVLLLRVAGYDVAAVADAEQAFAALAERRPDLIVLDLLLPGLHGLEFYQKMCQHEAWSQIPVVVITAVDDERVRQRAEKLGLTDYLVKPFEMADLLPHIRQHLHNVPSDGVVE
jgi:DNA-binding response OmpR family regulator